MGEQARLLLQQQLQAQREQYAAHLESELPELAALASRLQQPGALESRRQQVQNLRDRLHRMAGAAGTFGFTQVGNRARALEQRIDRWLDSQKPSGQIAALTRKATPSTAAPTRNSVVPCASRSPMRLAMSAMLSEPVAP